MFPLWKLARVQGCAPWPIQISDGALILHADVAHTQGKCDSICGFDALHFVNWDGLGLLTIRSRSVRGGLLIFVL